MLSGPTYFEPPRRVVITGMGVIAPNGQDLDTFWASVRDGVSAAGPCTRFDVRDCPSKFAAEIRNWNAADYMDAKTAKRSERSLQYGLSATLLAVKDARLDLNEIDADRVGLVEGTSLSNMEIAYNAREALDEKGFRAFSPTVIMSGYVGSGSAEIASHIGLRGHSITCSSSSASGNDVIGYALHMIQHEEVDVMLAGGAEAPIVDTIYYGFSKSRAMTRAEGDPTEAMKPFDRRGDGFVMGEGGAFLVLEELTHALSRNAKIYAEVLAHGRACEGYHVFVPHPDGWGVVRSMEKALRGARMHPGEVDYINVHGTANQPNDVAETRAIKKLFGSGAHRVAVSSTKPVTGHSLAASGAIETVICALALKNQMIPPTLNLREPLEECDLDYVPDRARAYPLRAVMSLNSGLGGKSSCLLLARYPR